MPFVGLAPMRLFLPNIPVLYHVDGNLQRANDSVGVREI